MLKTVPFLLALLILSTPAFAEQGCDSYPDIPVNITPVFDEPIYDFTADISDIQGLLGDMRHSIQENHDRLPLGVTHYQPIMEFHMPVTVTTFPDGLSCARVERADVLVGYKNVTVYIANEIPEGSCGFDQIMGHEQKHIRVNRQILQEYMPIIEGRLKDYLRIHGVFREENSDYAVSLLREKLQEILNGLGQQMTEDNRRRQHLIDSTEEYVRLTASCNRQLAVVAANFWGTHR